MIVSRHSLRSSRVKADFIACLFCQWQSFSTSHYRLAETQVSKPPVAPSAPSPLEDAPRSHGRAVSDFTPKPLSRPIGLPNPPRAGQNAGIDTRSWRQRRDDFVDYEKHLVRRKQLTQQISAPYFRDWSNMRLHKGKSFLAPPRLFKGERSLYFPNFYGQTLQKDKMLRDTTPVFEDKVSIVSVFSSQWAENQAATFSSEKHNPALREIVKNSGGMAQMIQINIEENYLKALIVRLFMGGLRRKLGAENWGRYFLVRKGISDEIRDAVGLLNSKVGYTYLLDGQCRIRWAASGPAGEDEREGLVRCTRRLIEEAKVKKKPLIAPTKDVLEAQKGAAASAV